MKLMALGESQVGGGGRKRFWRSEENFPERKFLREQRNYKSGVSAHSLYKTY